MITIDLHPAEPARPQSSGEFFTATARWSGREFSARTQGGVTMALARELVAAGVPDQPWQAARDGKVVMTGPSLTGVAALAISDPAEGAGPRFKKFVAFRLAPSMERAA
jgi:hypothetical protein